MSYKVLVIEFESRGQKRYFLEFRKKQRVSSTWHWAYCKKFLITDYTLNKYLKYGYDLNSDFGFNLEIDYAMTILKSKGYKPQLKVLDIGDFKK